MSEKQVEPYIHKVQYYETDQMAFVHHSNYIRWFEEARIDFMDKIGISYSRMEERGILSPVLSVTCDYRKSTKFGEEVEIVAKLIKFGNVKFEIEYTVLEKETKEVKAVGKSTNCFINKEGNVVSLKKEDLELFTIFKSHEE